MRYGLTLVTAPTVEPVSSTEAKAQLRLEVSDDDTLVGTLITTARRRAEAFLNRALIHQTWDLTLDAFPDAAWITMPLPPLVSITSVKYVDTAGTTQTWATANYTVDVSRTPGRVALAYNVDWPVTRDVVNAVTIRFVAGYGAAATDVPADLVQGIKILVAALYENRDGMGKDTPFPQMVRDLWAPHRIWHF